MNLEQIKDLLAKATPWTASVEAKPFNAGGHWYVVLDESENGIGEFYGDDHEANVANVQLAALAPTIAQALIDSRAQIDALREALEKVRPFVVDDFDEPILPSVRIAQALAAHPPMDEAQ